MPNQRLPEHRRGRLPLLRKPYVQHPAGKRCLRGTDRTLQTSSAKQLAVVRLNTTPSRRTSILATVSIVSTPCGNQSHICDLTSLDAKCTVQHCTALKTERSPFCKDHTCRVRACDKVTSSGPYCDDRKSRAHTKFGLILTSIRLLCRVTLLESSRMGTRTPGQGKILSSA
jgi:hypothetical protein